MILNTMDTINAVFVDNHHHRVVTRTAVLPASPCVRLTMACGLTLDCLPEWVHTPPETVDEHGAPIPWTITFSETAPADCPACG